MESTNVGLKSRGKSKHSKCRVNFLLDEWVMSYNTAQFLEACLEKQRDFWRNIVHVVLTR